MRETLPQKPFDFPISPSNSSTSSLVWCQILGVAVFSLFQPRVVHFDVPISRDRSASRSGPVSEGGKNHRLGRRMEGPSASNACRLQSLLSPALNNPPIHVNSRPGPTPFEVFIRLASLLEVMTGVPKNHHRTWKVLVVTAPRSSGGLWTLLTMYIYMSVRSPHQGHRSGAFLRSSLKVPLDMASDHVLITIHTPQNLYMIQVFNGLHGQSDGLPSSLDTSLRTWKFRGYTGLPSNMHGCHPSSRI